MYKVIRLLYSFTAPPVEVASRETTHPQPLQTADIVSSPSRSRNKRSLLKKKMSVDSNLGSSGHSRGAPPPPPVRRRTQPDFMKELALEMAGRKIKRTDVSAILEEQEGTEHQNEMETVSSELWTDEIPCKDLYPRKGKEDEEERGEIGEEMVDGLPGGMSVSPFRARKTLRPRTMPAPPPPSHNAPPTMLDGDTTPTFSMKRDLGETVIGVNRPKTQGPPPPVSSKPLKKASVKQVHGVGVDEPDSAVPMHELCTEYEGKGEDGEVGGVAKVKLEMAVVEESITSALMDQAGSR